MSLPLVSIITATKDRPDLLERAFRSAIGQSWRPLEICVVNDGGEDVGPLLRSWRAADVGVQYVDLPSNRGLGAARNVALELAQGDFLAYLDDDDVFLPEHVELAIKQIEVAGADACVSPVTCVLSGGDAQEWRAFDYEHDSRFQLVTNSHPIISVVHRRTDGLRFDPSLRALEDWLYLLRIDRVQQQQFTYQPEETVRYNCDPLPGKLSVDMGLCLSAYDYICDMWADAVADDPFVRSLQAHVRSERARHSDPAYRSGPRTYEQLLAQARDRFNAGPSRDES